MLNINVLQLSRDAFSSVFHSTGGAFGGKSIDMVPATGITSVAAWKYVPPTPSSMEIPIDKS